MKASLAFGVGLASGAIVASTLFLVSRITDGSEKSADGLANTSASVAAENNRRGDDATLRNTLRDMQAAAHRDREMLRTTLQEVQSLREAIQRQPPAQATAGLAPVSSSQASGLAGFLGAPVPVPANLDRKYTADELSAVFRDLADTLGIKVEDLAVDATEFPFVLHGRLRSSIPGGALKKIDSELRALPGYTYGGSVTTNKSDGTTYFALNMTPSSAYPREHAQAIGRRMMTRLQMSAATSQEGFALNTDK